MPAEAIRSSLCHRAGSGWVSTMSWDNLPELPFRPTSLSPHGLDWPLVQGSNRQFLIDKHFHPFVMPLPGK